MIAQSLRYHCAIATLSLQSRYKIIENSLRSSREITANALRNHCIIASKSQRNRCEMIAQSLRYHRAIAAKLYRSHCAAIPAQLLQNERTITALSLCYLSLRDSCAVTARSLRNNSTITALSLRNRCAPDALSMRYRYEIAAL
jgi:hypothetical protein